MCLNLWKQGAERGGSQATQRKLAVLTCAHKRGGVLKVQCWRVALRVAGQYSLQLYF